MRQQVQVERRLPVAGSVAVVLTAAAGAADAICFAALFGVFPANQSGNAVLLGIALGHPEAGDAWRPALAMVGFTTGIVLAAVARRRLGADRAPTALLVSVAVLLAAVATGAGDLAGATAPRPGLGGAVLLAAASVAMGLHTEVVRQRAGVAITTTYQTGAIVRIGESLTTATDPQARTRLAVLAALLAAYVCGAAIGAAALGRWGMALWGVVAAVVVLAAAVRTWPVDH
jgi:uncharacterized membrane protein YoaK (UPF0700 family)